MEDFGPLLGCGPVEDHDLHPLGDAVAEGNGALQRWTAAHGSVQHVIPEVQGLPDTPEQKVKKKEKKAASGQRFAKHNGSGPVRWVAESREGPSWNLQT